MSEVELSLRCKKRGGACLGQNGPRPAVEVRGDKITSRSPKIAPESPKPPKKLEDQPKKHSRETQGLPRPLQAAQEDPP